MRLLILVAAMSALCGCAKLGDPNEKPTYGDTGLPKNCRAIIKANVDGWRAGQYSAEETMGSIDRNCGEYGYSWGR
jgi:hypothetical protein